MQVFDLDWSRMIDLAGKWSTLPVMARRALLDKLLQVSPSTHASKLGTNVQSLIDAGFAVRMILNPDYVHLNAEYQSPLTAMRAMNRFKVFDDEKITLEAYLKDIFTQAECAELAGLQGYDMYRGASVLAERAVSPQWLDAFLAQKRLPRDLPYKPKRDGDRLKTMQMDPDEIHRAAQALVMYLMSRPTPVPLTEVPALLPDVDRPILARAIHEAIRHVLVFPALREGDFEPVLGIWPAITRRLNRVFPPKPESLAARPSHCFDVPFRMEDITALLIACSREPLRLRANGTLFSKACEDIYEGMVALPAWYSKFAGFIPDEDVDCQDVPPRIERAFDMALELKFTKQGRNDERKDVLNVTPWGMAWLATNPKERLKVLLNFVHIHTPNAPQKRRKTPEFLEDPDFTYQFNGEGWFARKLIWGDVIGQYWPHNWRHEKHELQIKKAIAEAFGALNSDSFYALDKFLTYHSQAANPLHVLIRESPTGEQPRFNYAGFSLREDVLERIWAETLMRVYWRALAPFGGASVASSADGKTTELSLTRVGRYVLGLDDDFDFAGPSEQTGALVVQPNFELVFLAPSPALEAACARFCERIGKGQNIGTLFRITRKAIHTAAGTGLTSEEVLATLTKAGSKALPRNVEHEIKDWFAQCRHVAIRHAMLIECPDAETAAKVARAWNGKSTPLTSTVVEISSSVKKAEIARKLRALGVFVRPTDSARNKGDDDGEL